MSYEKEMGKITAKLAGYFNLFFFFFFCFWVMAFWCSGILDRFQRAKAKLNGEYGVQVQVQRVCMVWLWYDIWVWEGLILFYIFLTVFSFYVSMIFERAVCVCESYFYRSSVCSHVHFILIFQYI